MSLTEKITQLLINKSRPFILYFAGSACHRLSLSQNSAGQKLVESTTVNVDNSFFQRENENWRFSADLANHCLKQLFEQKMFFEQYIALTLPDYLFSMGSFSVPTVAIKAGIQPLLERELRQSSELNIKESIIRYELGARTGSKLNLFYTAISRNLIEEIHAACDSARVLPVSIQPSFTGLIHLIKQIKTDSPHPAVVIHIDEFATTAGIFKNGGLLQLQLVPVGLKNLAERLSEDLNIAIEEACSIILKKLIILEDPSNEAQLEIVEYTILESIFADLLQKIYGFLLLFSNDHPEEVGFSRIILSGSGSGIKNLDRLFNANLGIATGTISSESFSESIPFSNLENFNVFAPAIGQALIQPWNNEGFERVFAA